MARAKRDEAGEERNSSSEEQAFVVHPVTKVRVGLLKQAPYNPKTISPEDLEALKSTIRQDGFVQNLIVQKHSPKYGDSVLIDGHQRIKAIRELCIEDNKPVPEELPAVVLDIDDRSAKKLNLKVERVGGDPEPRLLGELLEDLHSEQPLTDAEVRDLGFDDEEFRKMLHLADPPRIDVPEDPAVFGRSVTLSLEFKDVPTRDAVKAKLVERAAAEKKTSGEVVLGLLGKKR